VEESKSTALRSPPDPANTAWRSSARWSLVGATVIAFVAIVLLRATGPSDLWDQTQPRTIAYTADLLLRGGNAWILAQDADGFPATKPPLYNWLAAPFVALAGRESEFAHRFPSVLAMLATAGLLVWWGERLAARGRLGAVQGLGWLAALAWLAMFPTIKLGYLARPDMLLCLVLFVGWWTATRAIVERGETSSDRPGILNAATFWLMCALAAWTKGPVAICLIAYPPLLALVLHRSLMPLAALRPVLFALPTLCLAGLWYALAAWIDIEHFKQTLVYGEVVGRVTGNGPEGGGDGPMAILLGLPVMPMYFIARFAPWSIASVLGFLALFGREAPDRTQPRRWRLTSDHAVLLGALLWTALLVALFSLSSGKRADYIAPVYAPAALVAAWWLLGDRFSPIRSRPWLAAIVALVAIAVHAAVDRRGTVVPRSTMDLIASVATRAIEERERSGLPLVVVAPQLPHLSVVASTLAPRDNSMDGLRSTLAEGRGSLVLVGTKSMPGAIASMMRDGRAVERWRVDIPDDARPAGITHPLVLIEIRPEPAVTR
jgi:4-amino-4-deoxy-L-arabinose transferase-like glycosyltransferase